MKNVNLILKFLVISTMMVVFGCRTTNQPKYQFPDGLEDMGYRSMNNAKVCIEQKGTPLNNDSAQVKVITQSGEKKFNGVWGWRAPELNNAWVTGLTYTKNKSSFIIKVGCNPTTGLEVDEGSVTHEFGHVWMLSNYQETGHNPKYKRCFEDWYNLTSSSYEVKCMTILLDEGEFLIIDYIIDHE